MQEYQPIFDEVFGKSEDLYNDKDISNCSLCKSDNFIIDPVNNLKVCESCGNCKNVEMYDDCIFDYRSTHHTQNNKSYYEREARFRKCLTDKCNMKNSDIDKVTRMFERNLKVIRKAYYDSDLKNLNYNFIIRKLLESSDLIQYLQYYPKIKSKKSIEKSILVWKKVKISK